MKKERRAVEPLLDEVITLYRNGIKRCWNYIETSKKIEIKVENPESPDGYDLRVVEEIENSKRNDHIKTLQNEILAKIDDVINNYYTDEMAWFMLHGEDITEDIKLLSDNFNPTKETLNELCDRYRNNNYSMYSAIENYSKKLGCTINRIQKIDERMKYIQSFLDVTRPRFIADTSLLQEGNPAKKRNSFEITIEQYKENCLKEIR